MISDNFFKKILTSASGLLILLVVGIFITLLITSFEAIIEAGFNFLTETNWDPNLEKKFGVLPFLAGTLFTTTIAIVLAFPFSLSLAIFLGEICKWTKLVSFLNAMIELIAGIPSVILGFWGVIFLAPMMNAFFEWLVIRFPSIIHWPLLGLENYSGFSVFTASLVLAFMIIPFSASLSREVISLVPQDVKEAAYSMGATRYEVMKMVVIPYAKSGILAGVLLAIGRAMGETMVVTMLIGNRNALPEGLFSPSQTMASLIANEFAEASDSLYSSSLIEVALVLFIVTGVVNFIGRAIIKKLSVV